MGTKIPKATKIPGWQTGIGWESGKWAWNIGAVRDGGPDEGALDDGWDG